MVPFLLGSTALSLSTFFEIMHEEEKLRWTSLLVREVCLGVDLPFLPTLSAIYLVRKIYASIKLPPDILAQVSILIASKIEEASVPLSLISRVFNEVKLTRGGEKAKQNDLPLKVKQAEMLVLASFGFVVPNIESIVHPHRFIIWLCEALVLPEHKTKVLETSWGYLNDATLLDLSKYKALNVACASLALSCRDCSYNLPLLPVPWWKVIGGENEEIEAITWDLYELTVNWQPPAWLSSLEDDQDGII